MVQTAGCGSDGAPSSAKRYQFTPTMQTEQFEISTEALTKFIGQGMLLASKAGNGGCPTTVGGVGLRQGH